MYFSPDHTFYFWLKPSGSRSWINVQFFVKVTLGGFRILLLSVYGHVLLVPAVVAIDILILVCPAYTCFAYLASVIDPLNYGGC